jgi:predicted nucleic-acid-binding protein
MRAVDTKVLVRLIARDDPAQVVSAERFIEQGAWVPILALAEAVWVLAIVYEFTPKQIATTVEMLLNHNELAIQDPETIAAALGQFRARPALGFSDCLIIEMSRKAGHLPLGTFDRGLSKIQGSQRL